mmetsp:Transcript_118784/g.216069  ORF Transcript_118784/g.216069 Transcript_118784/m.216069 type:complete len:218 (+) Transcript_118784:89-742(+)
MLLVVLPVVLLAPLGRTQVLTQVLALPLLQPVVEIHLQLSSNRFTGWQTRSVQRSLLILPGGWRSWRGEWRKAEAVLLLCTCGRASSTSWSLGRRARSFSWANSWMKKWRDCTKSCRHSQQPLLKAALRLLPGAASWLATMMLLQQVCRWRHRARRRSHSQKSQALQMTLRPGFRQARRVRFRQMVTLTTEFRRLRSTRGRLRIDPMRQRQRFRRAS